MRSLFVRAFFSLTAAPLDAQGAGQVQLQAAAVLAPYWAEPWYMLGLMRDWGATGDAMEAYRAFMQRARRDDPRRAQVEPLIAATGG